MEDDCMSNNLGRKLRRKKSNKVLKQKKKEMAQQVGMFNLLPESCNICGKPFDKTSRDHHMTWRVAVNEEHRKVALVCPDCQGEASEEHDST
tara:strand:+ start:3178 stop:3453 length:276 start_codon:yes stop_codon:yes gene_type:complete